MNETTLLTVLLSIAILLAPTLSAQELPDASEHVVNGLLSGNPVTDEELAALDDLAGPAPTILTAIAVQLRRSAELAAREEALAELDPVRFQEELAHGGYDIAAAVAAGFGISSFVVQNILARRSNADLDRYNETDNPADLESARTNAARSLVAAGFGIVGLGAVVPFVAFGGRSEAPVAEVPRQVADLWWSSDPNAQIAQLRLERSRAASRLEIAGSAARGYTLGTIAAGGAGLAAGIVTTIAIVRGNELYRMYRNATFSSDAERYRREVEAQRSIALMSATVGTAGVGSMIALLLTRPKPEEIRRKIEAMSSQIERLESLE